MTESRHLLCVEVFHAYLDEERLEERLASHVEPTARALLGVLAPGVPWRPIVVIDDYFLSHPTTERDRSGSSGAIEDAEAALIQGATRAWASCWTRLGELGLPDDRPAPPALTFVRESDFELLAFTLMESLGPRLRVGLPARDQIDGSRWRRPAWTAGPVGAWLANARPPRSAPPRHDRDQLLHSVVDRKLASRHSVHLDVELFDCDMCGHGGRCPGFGRCKATSDRAPDLRMSCPALAAALHVGRVTSSADVPDAATPTVTLENGRVNRSANLLPPADRTVSIIDRRFIEVEHAVDVILDHSRIPAVRPTLIFF